MSSDSHQDSRSKALVPRPGTDLAETGRRTNPVIARMARDVLARAEAQGLSTARYRLGEYVLREPDYRQILDWAAALGKAPEWVLEQLADSRLEPELREDYYFELINFFIEPINFLIEDGAIRSLVWDFDRLPIVPKLWREGLLIHAFGLKGKWPEPEKTLSPVLPRLRILRCPFCGITRLDLSRTPDLIKLYCWSNQLTTLDLSPVPELIKLYCWDNQITELDLSPVPGLTTLNCGSNGLDALDLSPVLALTDLNCECNGLTALDLTPVPGLTALNCEDNQLTELDLSPVPRLTKLDCFYNQFTVLDLSPVPRLTKLYCWKNQITELDLTPVPGLSELDCDRSVRLINPPANLEVKWF